MRYIAILKDSLIITDDYNSNELKDLERNLSNNLNSLGIDYPVKVFDEKNVNVMTMYPFGTTEVRSGGGPLV